MSFNNQQQQLETINEYPRIVSTKTDPQTDETFLKAFLISDKLNKMHWQIPENALRKYVNNFIGRPLIQHPTGLHPDYEQEGLFSGSPTYIQDILKHQQQYAVGDIVDVQYEPIKSASGEKTNDSAWFAYIKLRNKSPAFTKLKSAATANESIFVSPQVIDLDGVAPGEKTTNFIPTHLAIVNEPAYGSHAKIRGMCNGHLSQCVQELKSAAYIAADIANQLSNLDNSSLVENSGKSVISMPKSNTSDQLQQQAQQVAATASQLNDTTNNLVQQQGQQQGNQPITEKKQTTEMTPDGKLVTKTEVAKPANSNNNGQQFQGLQQLQQQGQQPSANTQQNPNENQQQTLNEIPAITIPQNTDIPNQPNTNEIAFDWNKLPKEVKAMFESYQQLQQRVDEIDNFKKQEEENKVKQAAEQQRAQIEQALSVIQDDNVRSQLVEFFAGLPISDDQMSQLLNLLINGKFGDASGGDNAQAQAAPAQSAAPGNIPRKPKIPAKPGLKSAAFINNGRRFTTPKEFSVFDDSMTNTGLFGDLDLGNI